MAIRIGLPPTIFPRIRVTWHSLRMQLERQFQEARESARSAGGSVRTRYSVLSSRVQRRFRLRNRALARRQLLLTTFVDHYEKLVDLLCWAAKEGVREEHNMRYATLRAWLVVNYGQVKSVFVPFLSVPTLPGHPDAFERIFRIETIEDAINDISCIENMMETNMALENWRENLSDSD